MIAMAFAIWHIVCQSDAELIVRIHLAHDEKSVVRLAGKPAAIEINGPGYRTLCYPQFQLFVTVSPSDQLQVDFKLADYLRIRASKLSRLQTK